MAGCRGPRYLEIDSDVGSSSTAHHVTGMVQGALKSVIVDIGVLLEGRATVRLTSSAVVLREFVFSACMTAYLAPCMVRGAMKHRRFDLSAHGHNNSWPQLTEGFALVLSLLPKCHPLDSASGVWPGLQSLYDSMVIMQACLPSDPL